jgi:hypothetical protein
MDVSLYMENFMENFSLKLNFLVLLLHFNVCDAQLQV